METENHKDVKTIFGLPVEPQHTPTPWKVWPENGQGITTDRSDAKTNTVARAIECVDAAFIVLAVNCHEAFVKLARDLVDGKTDHSVLVHRARLLIVEDKQAIAKAGGR